MRRARAFAVLVSVLALGAPACTTRSGEGSTPFVPADAAAPLDAGSGTTGEDASLAPRIPDGGGFADDVVVWAHSSTELYSFDPRTEQVRTIGEFTVGGQVLRDVTDLAVDAVGGLWACSFTTLYRVDPTNAVATEVGPLALPEGTRFNALTFVPAGTLEPTTETLIGATAEGALYRVDTASGAARTLGQFGDGWGSSGDIVAVAGAGTFVTVSRDDQDSDVLARLDVATGAITPIGPTGHDRLYGLGYWRSRLYAFSPLGLLIALDIDDGAGSVVSRSRAIYWGAGVTTRAPTIPF